MPHIGLRNVKTAISVGICLFIYPLIILIAHIFNKDFASNFKIATQLYTPFFACLATAYSISTDKGKSLAQARLRLSASIIGGLFGLLVIAIYQSFGYDWPFQHISATGNPTTDLNGLFQTGFLGGMPFSKNDINAKFLVSFIVPSIITVFSVVFVIWFCNLIHQSQCSFIAVLTLTAVMASLGTNPIIYGPNRILSTVIGILVALGVNLFHLPHYKNKERLFIFSIDGIYTCDSDVIKGYNHFKMNQLINDGAPLMVYTTRTPGSLKPLLGEVKPKLPVICMSGSAVYDFKEEKYLYYENISNEASLKLKELFERINVSPFVNKIKDDLLYTYSKSLDNDGERLYAKNRKNARFISFNMIDETPYKDILYYVIVDEKNVIEKIKKEIEKIGLYDDLLMLTYDVYEQSLERTGYQYLKIYSKKILNPSFMEELKAHYKEVIGIGVHEYDTILLNNTSYGITTNNSADDIKNMADEVLNDKKSEYTVLFKRASKLYHKKFNE